VTTHRTSEISQLVTEVPALEWVYLGLGANLRDPVQQIVDARLRVASLFGVSEMICSHMYVSSPVGYSNQPSFINCVLKIKVSCSMQALFQGTQSIENELGRIRDNNNQNAPRLIDIDLLLFGEQLSTEPSLTVPHPRITERLFVLMPLLELLPEGSHPMLGDVAKIINRGDFVSQEISQLAVTTDV